MKKIDTTENLELFESGQFEAEGDFCFPRRMYVGFPKNENVCHNMKPAVTALVCFTPSSEKPGTVHRVCLDWLQTVRDCADDGVSPITMREEFMEALLKHLPDLEDLDAITFYLNDHKTLSLYVDSAQALM